MRQYFIHDGQNEKGPFDLEQLKTQSLKLETPIWYEGLEHWKTVGEIDEVKRLVATQTTPPPLRKKVEEKIDQPEENNYSSFSSNLPNDILPIKKSYFKNPLFIVGLLFVLGIFGWLIYQNTTQANMLNDVQQKVTEQDMLATQKQLDEEKLQQEKDKINAANTTKFMGYRNNWKAYIAASWNQYKYSELGGISDLEVIIYNKTDKIIDEVQVKVDYIKANGGTFKSETVSVTNIGPNSEKSVSAPSSERGTNVKMEIQSINAKSFHFCYPFGMEGNQNLDPYFCK